MIQSHKWSLSDKQKEEVNNAIYEQVQENLDDLTVFEDYWHGVTCSDGTVLDINIYDSEVDVVICPDGTLIRSPSETGLRCSVYKVDDDLNADYSNPIPFESEHLDGIDPNTNAQVEVYF
jgi:hypothetical protein